MNPILNTLKRIRWVPVLSVLFILLVIVILLASVPSRYAVKGKIGVSVTAKPNKVTRGEASTIEVEVKNIDKNKGKTVNVEAETFDDKFLFIETGDKSISRHDVPIGPRELRKIKFDVMPTASALPGKYRIDVTAREKLLLEGTKDSVYIRVSED